MVTSNCVTSKFAVGKLNSFGGFYHNYKAKQGTLQQPFLDKKQLNLALFPSQALEAIALRNQTIEAVQVSDDRYTVEIRLKIPIRFSREEVGWLLQKTDSWPGWSDRPQHCLSELGVLIEGAIAVGGAK